MVQCTAGGAKQIPHRSIVATTEDHTKSKCTLPISFLDWPDVLQGHEVIRKKARTTTRQVAILGGDLHLPALKVELIKLCLFPAASNCLKFLDNASNPSKTQECFKDTYRWRWKISYVFVGWVKFDGHVIFLFRSVQNGSCGQFSYVMWWWCYVY